MTDTEYEKIAEKFSGDGMYGDPTDTAVVTAGAGLSVTIAANLYGSVRGHAWSSGTSGVTLTITPNSSGSSRTDRVVLRLDRSTWTVRAVVKTGTAGSGAPALTQDDSDSGVWEIPLARVAVPNAATSVTVTREELYVGARCRPCTSTTRNPNPDVGELGYETDTERVILWTGAAWVVVYDYSGIVSCDSPLSAWNIIVESVLERRNGAVHLRLGQFERAGGSLDGASDSRLPILIPSAYRHPTRNVYAIAYITGADIGRLTIYSGNNAKAGQVWLTQKPDLTNGDNVLPAGASWVVD
ncbi:hypothetical protein [Streptomyces sp. C1-2]|uniref:hypothetical protein n=1 Tax=Streptomyces sp. C1-2 TaxID=2720022 RepID=UPI003211D106